MAKEKALDAKTQKELDAVTTIATALGGLEGPDPGDHDDQERILNTAFALLGLPFQISEQ